MNRRSACLLFIMALLCVPCVPSYAWLDNGKTSFSVKEMDLRTKMRELFSGFLSWERISALETLTGAPDTAKAQAKFAASQDDICAQFKFYFGDFTGGKITDSFKQFNQLLADYATAAKNRSKTSDSINKIYDKADELASILSMSNMNWTKKDLLDLLKKYADSITSEIDLQANTPGSLDTAGIDLTFSTSMDLADALSAGIVKQFPVKFW